MKHIEKAILAFSVPLLFTACEDKAPQISGVSDKVVQAGSEINVLDGVIANDDEDGNITKKILIESTPSLNFENGKVIPSKAGSYELTFTVTDKAGNEVNEYATLTVTKQIGKPELYTDFDFKGTENPYWTTFNKADENENENDIGSVYVKNGKLVYQINKIGIVDWHNKLIGGNRTYPITLKPDRYYTIEITAKATKNISCAFFLNPIGGWDPRIAEGIDFTTEEKTFKFKTKDTLITDMNFEMLFQFGSEANSKLGNANIEFSSVKIFSKEVIN